MMEKLQRQSQVKQKDLPNDEAYPFLPGPIPAPIKPEGEKHPDIDQCIETSYFKKL